MLLVESTERHWCDDLVGELSVIQHCSFLKGSACPRFQCRHILKEILLFLLYFAYFTLPTNLDLLVESRPLAYPAHLVVGYGQHLTDLLHFLEGRRVSSGF